MPKQQVRKSQAGKWITIETGIKKYRNSENYKVDVYNEETKKQETVPFKSLEAARAARKKLLEAQAARKVARRAKCKTTREKNAPSEKARAANLARSGNTLKQERDVVLEMNRRIEQDFAPARALAMNDATLSDAMVGWAGADLSNAAAQLSPQQTKTTLYHVKGCENQYRFGGVTGYGKMLVVCIVIKYKVERPPEDQALREEEEGEGTTDLSKCETIHGWIFDGEALDKRKNKNLRVAYPNKQNRKKDALKLSLTGKKPRPLNELLQKMKELQTKRENGKLVYPTMTYEEASWQFKAVDNFKERVSLYLYKTHIKTDAEFPLEVQNGSYDLVRKDANRCICERIQGKVARKKEGANGLEVDLHESAGSNGRCPTHRPYARGSFDTLLVVYIDWANKRAQLWIIPESALLKRGLLRTDTCEGGQTFYVYDSTERQSKYGIQPDTWTAKTDYYKGWFDLNLPEAALKMGKTFLEALGYPLDAAPSSSSSSSSSSQDAPSAKRKRAYTFFDVSSDEEPNDEPDEPDEPEEPGVSDVVSNSTQQHAKTKRADSFFDVSSDSESDE